MMKAKGVMNMPKMSDIDDERNTMALKQHLTLEEWAKNFGGKLGPYEEFEWNMDENNENSLASG